MLDAEPSEQLLTEAIQSQFSFVLQRAASDDELAGYLKLTRDAIALSGITDGIRQMLIAVLLESDFLYRLEFGAGEPDESGRIKMSPREAVSPFLMRPAIVIPIPNS
ncbi:MAG: hypothetical protein VYA84_03045 [Planctomycetota bacterium]|nr:hypothetical protein [Planctomycetota bacterium]